MVVMNQFDDTSGDPNESIYAINFQDLLTFNCPAGTQYDETNVELHVYRTTDDGTTFYKLAEIGYPIPNPIRFYAGEFSDGIVVNGGKTYYPLGVNTFTIPGGGGAVFFEDFIQNEEVIYNQGQSTQWTQAPPASFVEVIDDVA